MLRESAVAALWSERSTYCCAVPPERWHVVQYSVKSAETVGHETGTHGMLMPVVPELPTTPVVPVEELPPSPVHAANTRHPMATPRITRFMQTLHRPRPS